LRKLGKVLHYSKVSKRLIVKSKEAEPVRGYVADKTGYIIGKVDEVFGPTNEPYFAVKPYSKIEANQIRRGGGVLSAILRAEGEKT